MLIKDADENAKAKQPAAEHTACAQCQRGLYFPRIQLPDGEGGVDAYHPECAAKLAATITRDLQRLLHWVIM